MLEERPEKNGENAGIGAGRATADGVRAGNVNAWAISEVLEPWDSSDLRFTDTTLLLHVRQTERSRRKQHGAVVGAQGHGSASVCAKMEEGGRQIWGCVSR